MIKMENGVNEKKRYIGMIIGGIILFIILLIVSVILLYKNDDKTEITLESVASNYYTPGTYNSQIELGHNIITIEVVVDESQIQDVYLSGVDDTVSRMYPLLESSFESIKKALVSGTPIDEIPLNEKSKYTQSMFIEAIKDALDKARV